VIIIATEVRGSGGPTQTYARIPGIDVVVDVECATINCEVKLEAGSWKLEAALSTSRRAGATLKNTLQYKQHGATCKPSIRQPLPHLTPKVSECSLHTPLKGKGKVFFGFHKSVEIRSQPVIHSIHSIFL
jgi:hypothetical protein